MAELRLAASAVFAAAFAHAGGPAPVATTVCEAVQNPSLFDGKLITVRASFESSMETAGLREGNCYLPLGSNETYLSRADPDDMYAFVPVVRHPSNALRFFVWNIRSRSPEAWDPEMQEGLTWRQVTRPTPVTLQEDDSYREFLEANRKQRIDIDRRTCYNCPLLKIVATFTGRFDYSESPLVAFRSARTGRVTYQSAGFGHLSAAIKQMAMQAVSGVVTTPIDPATYEKRSR